MNADATAPHDDGLRDLDRLLPDLKGLYEDVHAHPELSMQETRTAGIAADRLRAAGYDVATAVGRTGVVGLLRNGDGPTVMLRADMDALPVREATGLPYASTATASDPEGRSVPVGHMCGHDMHVAWLAGAARLLAEARSTWRGTVMAVFQPGEETAQGARAMIDDGLFERFPKPDVILAQHVMVGPAGTVAGRAGAITSAADSLQIRLFGRGAHGSMPQASVDPVVMAAATVLRLQTIVSREVAAAEAAVVTVGALQAGTKENVIPDEALIKLNVRTFDAGVTRARARRDRTHRRRRGRRLGRAAQARDHPPRPLPAERQRSGRHRPGRGRLPGPLRRRARARDGAGAGERRLRFVRRRVARAVGVLVRRRHRSRPVRASEGSEPAARAAGQPQPEVAPVLHPTLRTGVEALVVASRAWLAA